MAASEETVRMKGAGPLSVLRIKRSLSWSPGPIAFLPWKDVEAQWQVSWWISSIGFLWMILMTLLLRSYWIPWRPHSPQAAIFFLLSDSQSELYTRIIWGRGWPGERSCPAGKSWESRHSMPEPVGLLSPPPQLEFREHLSSHTDSQWLWELNGIVCVALKPFIYLLYNWF